MVHIDGAIAPTGAASAKRIVPALEKAFTYPNVKAVVLSIDSPGGAAVEAERIYRAIESLKKKHDKPVIAIINNVGASAAYMIAMHTDNVYAAKYSLVGSIGTMIDGWDVHRAMERLDVAQRVYASGHLKSMLSPFLPMSKEAEDKAQATRQSGRRHLRRRSQGDPWRRCSRRASTTAAARSGRATRPRPSAWLTRSPRSTK